jgi:hypothetical protein
MTDDEMPVTLSDAEYDAIEAAVMETERGRWFLREYAKRNRNADTEAVLAALGKVEAAINGDEAGRRMDVIRAGLLDMARSIARTRQEMGLAPRESDDLKSFVDAVSEAAGPDGEREFEAVAEQRIRHLLKTLRFLEGHIRGLIALDEPIPDGESPFPGSARLADGPGIRAVPHPSFLM